MGSFLSAKVNIAGKGSVNRTNAGLTTASNISVENTPGRYPNISGEGRDCGAAETEASHQRKQPGAVTVSDHGSDHKQHQAGPEGGTGMSEPRVAAVTVASHEGKQPGAATVSDHGSDRKQRQACPEGDTGMSEPSKKQIANKLDHVAGEKKAERERHIGMESGAETNNDNQLVFKTDIPYEMQDERKRHVDLYESDATGNKGELKWNNKKDESGTTAQGSLVDHQDIVVSMKEDIADNGGNTELTKKKLEDNDTSSFKTLWREWENCSGEPRPPRDPSNADNSSVGRKGEARTNASNIPGKASSGTDPKSANGSSSRQSVAVETVVPGQGRPPGDATMSDHVADPNGNHGGSADIPMSATNKEKDKVDSATNKQASTAAQGNPVDHQDIIPNDKDRDANRGHKKQTEKRIEDNVKSGAKKAPDGQRKGGVALAASNQIRDESTGPIPKRGRSLGKPEKEDISPMGFKTNNGPVILIYKADITKMSVDVIVNAANGYLRHNGGVAQAIAKAAGREFWEESQAYVERHGRIKLSHCKATTAGRLPCKRVLHAVGPRWNNMSYEEASKSLEDTYENILEFCYKKGVTSIAMPAISSGMLRGNAKNVSAAIVKGLASGLERFSSGGVLKEIHLVDITGPILSAMQNAFTTEAKTGRWLKPMSSVSPMAKQE